MITASILMRLLELNWCDRMHLTWYALKPATILVVCFALELSRAAVPGPSCMQLSVTAGWPM